MKIAIHSNMGKQRKNNQDYADYYVNPEGNYLFILCDGVGGHQAGEVASELTTKFIGNLFLNTNSFHDIDINKWIHDCIQQVNHYIYRKSIEDIDLEGMATTLIMTLMHDDSIYIAHVGDSRAYAYYQQELVQLTEDHSLVNELIRSGEITREEGDTHPRRNIVTQSIGVTDEVAYELRQLNSEDITVLMLCSDGLSNMVSQEDMQEIFKSESHLNDMAQQLIDQANHAGGKDNITIILVRDIQSQYIEEGV